MEDWSAEIAELELHAGIDQANGQVRIFLPPPFKALVEAANLQEVALEERTMAGPQPLPASSAKEIGDPKAGNKRGNLVHSS